MDRQRGQEFFQEMCHKWPLKNSHEKETSFLQMLSDIEIKGFSEDHTALQDSLPLVKEKLLSACAQIREAIHEVEHGGAKTRNTLPINAERLGEASACFYEDLEHAEKLLTVNADLCAKMHSNGQHSESLELWFAVAEAAEYWDREIAPDSENKKHHKAGFMKDIAVYCRGKAILKKGSGLEHAINTVLKNIEKVPKREA